MTKQPGLLPGCGEAAWSGDPRARTTAARAAERGHAHPVAPGMAGHARHGHWRAHHVPVLLAASARPLCASSRRSADSAMMTSYFRIGGLALEPPKGFFESVQTFLDTMPRPPRPVRGPANWQPHLDGAAEGRGHSIGGGRDRAGRYRPSAARTAAWTGTCAAICPTPATNGSSSMYRSATTAMFGLAIPCACWRCARV